MNVRAAWQYGLAVFLALWTVPAIAVEITRDVVVSAGKHDRTNTPIRVPLAVPKALADAESATLVGADGQKLVGQLTPPALLDEPRDIAADMVSRDLYFVLPQLAAGKTARFTATLSSQPPNDATGYAWHDTPGNYSELLYDGRPVLRYMCLALDDSSRTAREKTYKVYHHLYDPAGKQIVTKGPGGLFPHHRGLFYGFNRIHYGNKQSADTWHCHGGAHQSHEKFLESVAGPVLGRHRLAIDWHGPDKKVFAHEIREMTVFHVPGGHLVEFSSQLSTADGPIQLDGDPQHAGFQFRASDEVAKVTKAQTYYVRVDGKGKPGETRNWPQDKRQANLPWNAMSFVLGDQRFTAAYLDKPTNPKEARYSERDYGRFGSYFAYRLTKDNPLDLDYRLWFQEGEMTGEEVAALSADFVDPPGVQVQ